MNPAFMSSSEDDEPFIDEMLDDEAQQESLAEEAELDEFSKEFVKSLIDKCIEFMTTLVGHPLHSYQMPLARRIIESVIINDSASITALAARQSGKSETIANTAATLMILMPRLAVMYPDLLGQYKNGIMIGMFAPVEGQVETLYGRTVNRLTSEKALELLGDPQIDDSVGKVPGVTRQIRLKNSGSSLSMMTANPKAKIESKSFQLIIIDECQEADDFVVTKSIVPMLGYYAGTMVKTGTPTTHKNNFYQSIMINKREQTSGKHKRQNHFEWDWRDVVKVNKNYEKHIRQQKLEIGEDSDEFLMSYCCKWMLERGMFVSTTTMDKLGDTSMEIQHSWHRTPVVVGIDPARKIDSTVVTVVWVDWDRPDEFGYYDHRILNWLEIQGDDWEDQYFQITKFLENYNVMYVGVDANGVGDAVAQRLKLLLPRAEVISVGSSQQEQSKRWKHLRQLIDRELVSWPAHAKTRRLVKYRRFVEQMESLETKIQGPNFLAHAPDAAHAHDDYADSLAIACSLTLEHTLPLVEVSSNPFWR